MNILKLFSGEQGGSEISLKTNTNLTIGNDITCDIYLATSSSTSATFTLNLPDEQHVQFELNDNLTLGLWNNTPIDSNTVYDLPLFFSFDSINIALGEPEQIAEWPQAAANDLASEDSFLTGLDGAELDQEVNNLNHGVNAAKPLSKLNLFLKTLQEQLAKLQKKLEPFNNYLNQKYRWASTVVYTCVAILLLIITLVIFSSGVSLHQEHKIQQWLTLEADLKKTFNDLPRNGMSLSLVKVRDKQQFVIQGLVYSTKEQLMVQNKLARFKPILSYKFMLVPQVITKIKTILATYNMNNFQVIYESANQNININGVGEFTDNAINDAEIDVTNQLVEISDINFSIYEASNVKNDFAHDLGELNGMLDVTDNLANGSLTVSGYLTAKQLTTYNNAVTQFNNKYQQIVTINSNIKDAVAALGFSIYGVFVGNPSYIITEQGDTIFVGGVVGKFRLTSVTDSKITLSNDDSSLEIPLSQISNQQPSTALNDTSRKGVLAEELAKNQQGLKDEQNQLIELKKYQPQLTTESSAKFIQHQLHTLEEDIQTKSKDVTTLESMLNA